MIRNCLLHGAWDDRAVNEIDLEVGRSPRSGALLGLENLPGIADVGGHCEPMQRDNICGKCTESSIHSRASHLKLSCTFNWQ